MRSGFCGRRKTPLFFASRCSFISLPSVHFSAEILTLSSLQPPSPSPPGPRKCLPPAPQSDLRPQSLSPSDPSCGSWQGAGRSGSGGRWAGISCRDSHSPYNTQWLQYKVPSATWAHASWKNYIFVNLPQIKGQFKVLLYQSVTTQRCDVRFWHRTEKS